jgi:serine/threonine protein kinase
VGAWISGSGGVEPASIDYHPSSNRDQVLMAKIHRISAPDGVVKLVNFDLALIQSSLHRRPDDDDRLRQRFDRRYVVPEVWRSPCAATPVSDIYSLGIVFYQLITGETPYGDIEAVSDAGGVTPLNFDLLMGELGTPGSEDLMKSPEDAAAVIRRMVDQKPGRRYQSMDEVCEDLTILKDE